MSRVRIKFCGLTRESDAREADRLGADAIGLVFHPPSPRHLGVERARRIVNALGPFITPVALFVNAPARAILNTVVRSGARCVQLHGDEAPSLIAELAPLPVIKAVHVHAGQLRQSLETWRDAIARLKLTNLRGLLLETAGPLAGGSGLENDWGALAEARGRGWFDALPPIIAAGGLTVDNVVQVIDRLHPWAVDVSSGIESAPGVKSPGKMEAFARAVARASHEVG